MPFNIIRDDITNLDVDVIVNAANKNLLPGGGVCGAIFSAAGKEELSKACSKIGFCKTGEAVITKGFNLKAKYIIHTVGPIYGQDPKNEEKQLYSCYEKSLILANKKKLTSIAFPVISSGIYGYPKSEAIKIATKAIKSFLLENEMNIYLVVYDNDTFRVSEKLFSKVKSYIEERMIVSETRRTENCLSGMQYRNDVAEPCCVYDSAPSISYSEKLTRKKNLNELLNIKTETFSQMLLRLIDEKSMTDVEVYKRANIDRKLFSKIRKKDYVPKKITVIALVIALRLNMQEAKILLAAAGYAFAPNSKFDIIIEYFIENQNYDIFEINETLFTFEQQLLGA